MRAMSMRESGCVSDEIRASLGLIEQILGKIPEGPFRVERLPAPTETCEGAALVEGFRGDIFVWLRLGSSGTVQRCHLRDPSWFQWPLLEAGHRGKYRCGFSALQQVLQLLLFRARSLEAH